MSTHSSAVEAVGRLIEQGSEADELLRGVVAILHERYPWVGISFVEEGDLVLGPSEGERTGEPVRIPISYDGKVVAELGVAGDDQDRTSLEQVARADRAVLPRRLGHRRRSLVSLRRRRVPGTGRAPVPENSAEPSGDRRLNAST